MQHALLFLGLLVGNILYACLVAFSPGVPTQMRAWEIAGTVFVSGIPLTLAYGVAIYCASRPFGVRALANRTVLVLISAGASLTANLLIAAIRGGVPVERDFGHSSPTMGLAIAVAVHAIVIGSIAFILRKAAQGNRDEGS
jgi:hypothetical protein